MRWFKVAVITVSVLIAYLVVASVVGFLIEIGIAALIVGAVIIGIKAALRNREISRYAPGRAVRGLARDDPPPGRHSPADVDDEMARLKREMGG